MASLRDFLEIRIATPCNFSPEGAHLLVATNLTGTNQLYRVPVAGGPLEQLTDTKEPVTGWYLPDGSVLVESDVGGNERLQLSLLDPDSRVVAPLVHDTEFIHRYGGASSDGRLISYSCNRRNGRDFDVYVRDLETGDERCVFQPGGWVDSAGFSPDGRWVACVRASEKPADSDLYLVDLHTGEQVHVSPHDDEAEFESPAWFSDSSGLFFSANTGRDNAAIARYELATGSWEYVIEDEWDLYCVADSAGRHLLVVANVDGYTRLELRDPSTLALVAEVPLPEPGVVNPARVRGGYVDPVLSPDGRYLAYHFTSPRIPGDVWLYDSETAATARLTESPSSVPRDELVEPELVRLPSFDGEPIPAFVFAPEGAEGLPVIVYIHGGPEGQSRPLFLGLLQYFLGAGFAVVVPNVRGSTGYGKRFEHLDDVHKRLDSVHDLVAVHDLLARDSRFDEARVTLWGGSYGGYMVLAGLAFHPELWAAGVDVVGISNLVTFLENTAEWRRVYREREYGSLERDREFLESVSPLTRADRIRAPLFVIHGANDPRVPLGETEQIHRKLTTRGVRCDLLVYDDEGHGLHKLKNRLDAYPRAVAFLEEVLGL